MEILLVWEKGVGLLERNRKGEGWRRKGGGGVVLVILMNYDDNGEGRGEEKERWMRKVGRVGVLWVLQG